MQCVYGIPLIQAEEFYEIAAELKSACQANMAPPMRLLYTAEELENMRKHQIIANVTQYQGG